MQIGKNLLVLWFEAVPPTVRAERQALMLTIDSIVVQMRFRSLSVFSWERIIATSATAATATMYQAGATLEPVV